MEVDQEAQRSGLQRTPIRLVQSLSEVYRLLELRPPDFEGYVLRFTGDDQTYRIKVKKDSYKTMHLAASNMSTKVLYKLVLMGEVEELMTCQNMKQYSQTLKDISDQVEPLFVTLEEHWETLQELADNQARFGQAVQALSHPWKSMLFERRLGRIDNFRTPWKDEYTREKYVERWINQLSVK